MIVLHPLRKPSWTGSAASKVTNRNTNKNQVKSNAPLPKARELLAFALPFFVIPRAPLAAYSSLFLRPPACDPPDPSPLFSRDRRLMDFPSYSTSKDQARIYNDWFSFADSGSLPHPFCLGYAHEVFEVFFLIVLDGDGRITGNDAIKFFSLSNLSRPDLKQVKLF